MCFLWFCCYLEDVRHTNLLIFVGHQMLHTLCHSLPRVGSFGTSHHGSAQQVGISKRFTFRRVSRLDIFECCRRLRRRRGMRPLSSSLRAAGGLSQGRVVFFDGMEIPSFPEEICHDFQVNPSIHFQCNFRLTFLYALADGAADQSYGH